MSLTTRLNIFFLSALAVVLIGFSSVLYLLAREHLKRQAHDQLDAAIHVLSATVEVNPDGLEWEPTERRISLGSWAREDSMVWLVTDPEGQIIDSAGVGSLPQFAREIAMQLQTSSQGAHSVDRDGKRWLFQQHWMESSGSVLPLHPASEKERLYRALGLTVGLSLEPMRATLRELGAALAGLSSLVWCVALLAGRFVCRRALKPVRLMATAAQEMNAAQLEKRLPVIHSGDELEALGRAFNGLLDRVGEAFERQRRFTEDASHQLRTPLAAVLGEVEVALRRERGNEEYRRTLASVQEQAERLRQIVESLLFLTRADADTQMPHRIEIDLAGWLTGHLQRWHDHPRARDIATHVHPASARVHPILLGELLNILLDNALKYSQPGSPVTISIDTVDDTALIAVEDQGIGVSEEDLPHLFEPFFRSPIARLQGIEGLGLGLSVAKRIAEAFGGSLSVSSHPGKGSRFVFQILSRQTSE